MNPTAIVILCLTVSLFAFAFLRLYRDQARVDLEPLKPLSEFEAWKKFHRPGDHFKPVQSKGLDTAQVARVIRLEDRKR